jgi:hypothetical protein
LFQFRKNKARKTPQKGKTSRSKADKKRSNNNLPKDILGSQIAQDLSNNESLIDENQNVSIFSRSQFFKLPIVRKTISIIDGEHPSIFKGMGNDFADFQLYQPGDDPKSIDWKSSAKHGDLVTKRFYSNSNTNLTLLIDSGKLLLTRTNLGYRKIDVLETICETFAYLSTKRLDAVGIIAGDEERIMSEKAKLSYGELRIALNKIASIASPSSPNSSFQRVLLYANQSLKKRTFVGLVFDESQFYVNYREKFALVRRHKERHDLFAVSLKSINPFISELPQIDGNMIDISSQNFIPAYYRSNDIASVVDKEISRQRNIIRNNFKKLGVPLICVGGSDDFLRKLSKILMRAEVRHY